MSLDRGLPARLRARQPGARAARSRGVASRACGRGSGPRCRDGRDEPVGPPQPTGARACATSSCAKAAAPASCRCGSSAPTASSTSPARRSALAAGLGAELLGGAVDALAQPRRDDRRGRDRAPVGRGASCPSALCGLDLRISAEAFFQTNTEMAEMLYGAIGEYAALKGWERVYDLYCGIGSIAPDAGPARRRAVGHRAARARGRRRDRAAPAATRITNAHFFAGETRTALPRAARSGPGRADVIVVDPPARRALARRSCSASSTPARGGSCTSPATPRRSPRTPPNWWPAGCALRRVRPVDMFPQTHHIECVALLERRLGFSADARRHDPREGDPRRGPSRPRRRAPARCSSRSAPPA